MEGVRGLVVMVEASVEGEGLTGAGGMGLPGQFKGVESIVYWHDVVVGHRPLRH